MLEEPRSGYHGKMGIDEVTGRYQPQYPKWKTNAKVRGKCVLCIYSRYSVLLGQGSLA